MIISVLSIFPELFESFLLSPVIARQIKSGSLSVNLVDIKDYAGGSFRHIDDSPYGGGPGMILRCAPVVAALRAAKEAFPLLPSRTAALTPAGCVYRQADARRFSLVPHLILICGHYEGMDERIYDYVDERISVGDYILTGGEVPAMTVIDSVTRLLSGALRKESTEEESFEKNILEYPQYTRPAVFEGRRVPDVLLSGNHAAIEAWRQDAALALTRALRPDL